MISSASKSRPGKLVRVRLELNEPYDFEVPERGPGPGASLFHPSCDLAIIPARDSGASAVRRTNQVNMLGIPFPLVGATGSPEEERYLRTRIAARSDMRLEFTPADTDTYRIEFKGTPKGFRKYRLVVEQQGL